MYRILSIDGGGLRGLIALRNLCRLEEKAPGFLASVDLCAGTSTGAFIACGLAAGMSPGEMIDFYLENGEAIFNNSLARRMEQRLDELSRPAAGPTFEVPERLF